MHKATFTLRLCPQYESLLEHCKCALDCGNTVLELSHFLCSRHIKNEQCYCLFLVSSVLCRGTIRLFRLLGLRPGMKKATLCFVSLPLHAPILMAFQSISFGDLAIFFN